MPELPDDLIDEVERLTRLARRAVDEDEAAAYEKRRRTLLDDYEFTARVREEDDTLVVSISRDNGEQAVTPKGNTVVEADDLVTLFSRSEFSEATLQPFTAA